MINLFEGVQNWNSETLVFVNFIYQFGYVFIHQRNNLVRMYKEVMGASISKKTNILMLLLLSFNLSFAALIFTVFAYFPIEGCLIFIANTLFYLYRLRDNANKLDEYNAYLALNLPFILTLILRIFISL